MGDDGMVSGSWGGAFGPTANPAGRMSADRVPIRAFEPRRQRPEAPDGVDVHMEIPHLTSAVDLVQELATQRWRRTAALRLADHLGEDIWAQAEREWLPSHCKKLAKAAGNAAGLDPGLSGFDTVLGRQRIKDAVKRTQVGAALVGRVTAADTPVDSVVAAMRVAGIILCELHGCIASCQSLRDLARDTAPALLRARIDQVCDGYLLGTG
jgi:hypothetical protein